MPVRERNRIIIFGWDAPNCMSSGEKSFGHVSLQTIDPPGYHSFWPKNNGTHRLFKKETYDFKKSLGDDTFAEKRDPDWAVCLYTLNSSLIEEKAITMKKNINSWCPNGTKHDESCASFVYRLLEYANIENLYKISRTTSASMTPEDLKKIAFHAKIKEYDHHNEAAIIQTFHDPVETPIDEIRAAVKSNCCIL